MSFAITAHQHHGIWFYRASIRFSSSSSSPLERGMMMPSFMASFASLHSWEAGSAIDGSAKLSSGHNNAGFPGHSSAVAHLEGTKKLESSFLRRRKNCRRVVRHTACSVVVRVPSKACASPNFPLCLVSSHLQQQWKATLKETKSTARALDDKHVESQTETSLREKSMIDGPLKAAFFDVDGTITRTNVVLAYFAVRMSELPLFLKLFWVPWFALKGIFYLLIDRIDRALFNRVFYRSYNGRSTSLKDAMAALIYKKYYKPRIFNGAVELIQQLKERGYKIVFVTGALDFQIAPLALDLGADFVYAAELVEKEGRFTGKLKGMAASNTEKADRMQEYARVHGVSLADSLAFGDSIADLPMLEIAGQPHAVNPDSRLKAIATKRGWPILQWSTQPKETSQYAAAV
ncbi:unnamed protein product [Sphagnum balticum]